MLCILESYNASKIEYKVSKMARESLSQTISYWSQGMLPLLGAVERTGLYRKWSCSQSQWWTRVSCYFNINKKFEGTRLKTISVKRVASIMTNDYISIRTSLSTVVSIIFLLFRQMSALCLAAFLWKWVTKQKLLLPESGYSNGRSRFDSVIS